MSGCTPFLLEIGTEEIPARFFRKAIPDMEKHTADLLEKNRIAFSDIQCVATPRRLTVTATITDPLQKSIISEATGPPIKAAYDADNNPTKAAEGFARSQGIKVSDLKTKNTDRGDYIVAIKEVKGEKVAKVLPTVVPHIISSLHFPKAMRWASHSFRFARPVRWILCLYGESVVKFDIDGIISGSYTWGHRLLANRKIKISSPQSYEKELKSHSVVVNQTKRKALIEKSIENITKKSSTKHVRDDELLDTVNFLVEYPYAVQCSFPEEYLTLPDELLITVMKDHQKYLALTNKRGKLVNSFIVISNTNSKVSSIVRAGAEKVIRARFEDARFYYNEDIKMTLEQRREALKGVTFHEKIGTVYEKVERIGNIAADLSEEMYPSIHGSVLSAAELCKSDLTAGVVREFPELQGIIGYYYALNEKLPDKVARAIKEHYKPLHAFDTVPSTDEGKIVSMADKIDSIVSFFSVGITPTGSEDPFALRRQAQGIVQILMKSDYLITLHYLIDTAIKHSGVKSDDVSSALHSFFTQRIEYTLSSSGYRDDVVQSILHESLNTPLHVLKKKAEAISSFKKLPGYNEFIMAVKRVHNILPESPPDAVKRELFSTEEERMLYGSIEDVSDELNNAIKSHDFSSSLTAILSIKEPINTFFDNVLVMDKDENIKNNRLGLLKHVWETTLKICDCSKLAEK